MVQGSLAFGLYNLADVSSMGEELCFLMENHNRRSTAHTALLCRASLCLLHLSKKKKQTVLVCCRRLAEMGPLTKGHIVAVQMTVTSWVLTAPAPGQGVWAHRGSFYGRRGLQSNKLDQRGQPTMRPAAQVSVSTIFPPARLLSTFLTLTGSLCATK